MPEPEAPQSFDEERRRRAETRKLEAEALKLEAEIEDLHRTPWQRPGTWVALGSAVVAITAGLITIPTGYFSREKTIAEQQRQISEQAVEAAKTKLELNQAQAEARVQRLNEQFASAENQHKADEEKQKRSLEEIKRQESVARKALSEEGTALQKAQQEEGRLQTETALAPFNELMTRLEGAFAEHVQATPLLGGQDEVQYRAEIKKTLSDLSDQLRQKDAVAAARLARVKDEIAKASTTPLLSGLLLHALYQATGDSGVRGQLFDLVRSNPFTPDQVLDSAPSLPLELILGGQYDNRDKASLTCFLTDGLVHSQLKPSDKGGRLYILAAQDANVLDICPAPFIKAIQTNRDLVYGPPDTVTFPGQPPDLLFTIWMSKIIGLSSEAASVYIADLTAKTGRDLLAPLFGQNGGQSLPIQTKPHDYFLNKYDFTWPTNPAPFGRYRQQMEPTKWPQWLEDHKKLAALWLEPDLGTLTANPNLMKQAVRGVWLGENDIPAR
jgi:hypothetical protein